MTTADASSGPDWSFRADDAARAVTRLFGQRLFFLPGTHLAATSRPSSALQSLFRPWHFWWQAHYLDCLVDTARRELANEDQPGAGFDGTHRPTAAQLASRLLTGIRFRNGFSVTNDYYDDMAWLALATLRLDALPPGPGEPDLRQRNAGILHALAAQLDSASTDDLGGGTFWSSARDYKNAAATGPVALFKARTGDRETAQALLDWLDANLLDPDLGLYRDGLRLGDSGEAVLESAIYTYNQGPALAALLELGGDANLDRAAALVSAVAENLTLQVPLLDRTGTVLRCEGPGDGGLFTGILARYLAMAARDERLPDATRATATELVTDTAIALWEGRRMIPAPEALAAPGGRIVFSAATDTPGRLSYPAGTAVELSTQLQAWMVLEAAAAMSTALDDAPHEWLA